MKINKYLLIIITLLILCFLFWFFKNDSDINREIKNLKQENELLNSNIEYLNHKNDSLISLKNDEVIKYIYIQEKIKLNQYETINAVNNVDALNEKSLDSTIRNYKHPIRN